MFELYVYIEDNICTKKERRETHRTVMPCIYT